MAKQSPPVPARLRFLRRAEVESRTGLSRSAIYLRCSQGRFPRQIHLSGGRSVGWIEDEIDQWMQQQVDASRSGAE